MAEVVAIIPARSGSKGFPDKNIRPLARFPLIAYSIAVARLIHSVNRIVVSTDSEIYADIARKYGGETPFLRPPEISGDNSTDYDFIKHALDWMRDNEGYRPDYLVHLRPTTPLRERNYIEMAIDCMIKTNNATALRSVHEMSESAYKAFEIDGGYLKSIGSSSFALDVFNDPRQKFNATYQANGYVDIIRTSCVLENHMIHGERVIAFITPRVIEVDTVDEFEYLEYHVANNPTIIKKIFGK